MLHLCVCAHCCCLTGVNYALIRHAFFCSIYIALLGQHRRQIDECRQWCSAVNCYVVQRLVPILASRNAIGDTHNHSHACIQMYTAKKDKSQWNRKRCYTNSEHCWCCVDCCTQFAAFFLASLKSNRIEWNGIAPIVCGLFLYNRCSADHYFICSRFP